MMIKRISLVCLLAMIYFLLKNILGEGSIMTGRFPNKTGDKKRTCTGQKTDRD